MRRCGAMQAIQVQVQVQNLCRTYIVGIVPMCTTTICKADSGSQSTRTINEAMLSHENDLVRCVSPGIAKHRESSSSFPEEPLPETSRIETTQRLH